MCETESQLMRDLQKFYSVDAKFKGGMEEIACEFADNILNETKVTSSLVTYMEFLIEINRRQAETLKVNRQKTKLDYEATFQIFKVSACQSDSIHFVETIWRQ